MKDTLIEYRWLILAGVIMIIILLVVIPIEQNQFEIPRKCNSFYSNKTFMDKFDPYSDSPHVPYRCKSLLGDRNAYSICINTDQDEYYFITHCGWMMPDYLILFGLVIGNVFVILFIGIIYMTFFKPICRFP